METNLRCSKTHRKLWLWLAVLLLSVTAQVAHADRIKDDKYYKVTQYSDHVSLEILVADLDVGNTWCKWGSIRAYSQDGRKGEVFHILDVENDDNGDDDSETWEIYAHNRLSGSQAFLTNPASGGEVEIGFCTDDEWSNRSSNVRYRIQKGKSNEYPTVKIDYYYPAEMAGRRWYFYYEYLHSKGSSHNMSMGSAYCSADLNLQNADHTKLSYERTGSDKIKFTVPSLPNDIPQKLQKSRTREGEVTCYFYYMLKDGRSMRRVGEKMACAIGSQKTYELTIPAEYCDFRNLDLTIEVKSVVRNVDGATYSMQKTRYDRNDVFEKIPTPHSLTVEFNQFDNKATLSWNAFRTEENHYIKETIPYVYRIETDRSGNPLSGQTWQKRTSLDAIGTHQAQGYTDSNVSSNSYYRYMVVNVPKAWINNKDIPSSDLNSPGETLLTKLAHTESDLLQSEPTMSIYNLSQDTTVTDKVKMTWEYSRVPVKTQNVSFEIFRRTSASGEWVKHGSANGPATPSAGQLISYTDKDLPSYATYQYKIRLSINNGTNVFESDVLTASLQTGTKIQSVTATKGAHENTVRVAWTVKHVGTDDTSYEVSRRYAGTNDDFLKIYTVSGHASSYSYEDNTVQPGYYYEYRVDAFSGDLNSDTDVFQSTMNDVGFCQARGVVSGKISFGSGNGVENVRLSLRTDADDDGQTVRSYSQRVDGASTGIVWKADSAEIDKLFGANKDYTLQLFVRPDEGIGEGAVLGELPFRGKLRLGKLEAGGHKLQVELYDGPKNVDRTQYTQYWDAVCIIWNADSVRKNTSDFYSEELGGWVCGSQASIDSICGIYNSNREYKFYGVKWIGDSEYGFFLYGRVLPLSTYVDIEKKTLIGKIYDTGLTVSPNSYTLVNVSQVDGQLYFTVNDSTTSELKPLSTKEHVSENSNLATLYPDLRTYDGCLYQCTGLKSEILESHRSTSVLPAFPDLREYSTSTETFVNPFSIGGSEGVEEAEAFRGNLTEVRVWNHILSDKERTNYNDRVLSGRETGLALYWPMDEGVSRFVFDASYANDVPNGRHATVGNNISSSTIIPTETQLSRYGVTNEKGEYTIRGIPFVGAGTTYTVTPSKNIHVFSPTSRNGFIGKGSLALNNYDFTDESSFPMRGVVRYANTNIPADSIQFKIDGNIVQTKDGAVMSDANGEYEISVPIGEHKIEAYKEGHLLSTFPLDGSTHDFLKEETVNFFDSTLVNITGRINGGFSDQDEPVGFRRSVNRLGKAVIKLSLGKESQCSFNYVHTGNGIYEFGTEPIPVASATPNIKSTAYRGGGSHDETNYIYITTDEGTGEYSALVPPLRYKVESITFAGGKDYDDEPVFAQNLPIIDATNTVKEALLKDTLATDQGTQNYTYTAKMNRQFRKSPNISVVQHGMKNGAFGEEKIAVANERANADSVRVLNYNGDKVEYVYGKPIVVQQGVYEFDILVNEQYKNLDSKETFEEVPRDAIVSIMNDASRFTSVYAEKVIVNGEEMQIGATYEVPNIRVIPDEQGYVSYQFVGGWPNLAEGNQRTMTVGVKVDGRTTMWTNPTTGSESLDMILLGSISSGMNFMTEGPDDVDMIIRRPPGSTSEAVYSTDTIRTTSHTDIDTHDGKSFGGGFYISVGPKFSFSEGVGVVHWNNELEVIANTEHVWERKWWDTDTDTKENSYSVTREIHGTTEGIQNNGDTYIGRSTNFLFGKGWELGIFKQADGTYKLSTEEAITMAESFGTYFAYSQEYIEETLIPNWENLVRDKLKTVSGNHWENPVRVPGEVRYYTKYKEGDPEWGLTNGDSRWSVAEYQAAGGYPSYIMVDGTDEHPRDEVEFAINQIKNWKNIIAINEKDKIDAFDGEGYFLNNYSIAGGTSISETTTTSTSHTVSYENNYELTYNTENQFGVLFNAAGAYGILIGSRFHGDSHTNDTTVVNSHTTSWTMSDADPRTALSVDVYKSPRGFGPIFRTRGGQTANPYEGATYTKYYNEGTQLDEATMRVEVPKLTVEGPSQLSNVPSGGVAKFELQLYNGSETKSACTYVLEVIESSNTHGAILSMDGAPLSIGKQGRLISMDGGETINKILQVRQSDTSVNSYDELKLVLRSEKDDKTTSDTISLFVEFVPSSAIVDMAVDHTVLNYDDLKKYKGFRVKFTNLDRQDKGLLGVRVQYRRKGYDSWSLAHQWRVNEAELEQGDELLPAGNSFECAVAFEADGVYELRGQTWGKYGNDDVTYETQVIEVTQDTRGPKMLGMPSHADRILTYADRNDMHVRFNEPLNTNAISHTDNFTIEGYLNNLDQSSQYTDVALQLYYSVCRTQATYTLNNNSLAVGLWFYRQSDGNIVSLTSGNGELMLRTENGGELKVYCNDKPLNDVTPLTIPAEKWVYLALSYKCKDTTDPNNRITVLMAGTGSDRPQYLAQNAAINDVNGTLRMVLGGLGTIGRMHDLTLWNQAISAEELYERRNEQKSSYTPGLVGYWRMDEGHGTTLHDKAQSRHLTMHEDSWYINNKNLAAHLTGDEPMKIDISTFAPRITDNYALELWFNGDAEANKDAQLLSVMNAFSLGFNEGKLVLEKSERKVGNDNVETKTVSESIVVTESNYLDNSWHHLALNVRRGTSAIVYIDGQAVRTLPEATLPGFSTHYMFVGGEETLVSATGTSEGGSERHFTGDIDEVRIWATALTSGLIEERRWQRMPNGLYSLMGYFPMEDTQRDSDGNIKSTFNSSNFGYTESQLTLSGINGASLTAPALLPSSSRLRLEQRDFEYTVSDQEIYFTFPETMLPLMDGNEFVAKIENLRDTHGNVSEPVEWKFTCDFASIKWDGDINLDKEWSEQLLFSGVLENNTDRPVSYEITGLPNWMKCQETIGTVQEDEKIINFTIEPSVPVGRHSVYLTVTDRLGISRKMLVNLTVHGEEPQWAVDPNLYESNMFIIGQIRVNDKICMDSNTKLAAFDEQGNCRGVASPEYMPSRDTYFVNMVVYGGSANELSTSQRELTFQIYDASSGITYPFINISSAEGWRSNTLTYNPDATVGTYSRPLAFEGVNWMIETVSLPRGWSWVSLYTQPESTAINDVLALSKSDRKKFLNVKGKTTMATPNKENTGFIGTLTDLVPGNMYKMQVSSNTGFSVYGTLIDPEETRQTIYPGYNWIGSLSNSILSLDDAFADLSPIPNDMIKTRTAVAMYSFGNGWEGTLKNLVPGVGYIYLSRAAGEKTFHYPVLQTGTAWNAPTMQFVDDTDETDLSDYHYQPTDDHLYADNMNVIAVVKKDGVEIADAEVAAICEDTCRGTVKCTDDFYFLTILGNSRQDENSVMHIKVWYDGVEYEVSDMPFVSDAIYGTLDEPVVFDLDAAGIGTLTADDPNDTEWYTLEGFKIGRRPMKPGIYIHNGKKVTLKRQKN